MKFKDVISNLSEEKQTELINWRKNMIKKSSIKITCFVLIPVYFIGIALGLFLFHSGCNP